MGGRSIAKGEWVPHLLLILFGLVLVVTWFQIRSGEANERQFELAAQAEHFAAKTQLVMNDRTSALQTLRDAWLEQPPDEQRFRVLAARVFERFTGFAAINWVDDTKTIRWVYPPGPNANAKDVSLGDHPQAGPALERSVANRILASTGQIELLQGGQGFAMYLPVYRDGRLEGFINGVFRTDILASLTMVGFKNAHIHIRLEDGKTTVAQSAGFMADEGSQTGVIRRVPIGDRQWTVVATATPPSLFGRQWADEALLAAGLLIAIFFFIALRVVIRRRDALQESQARYQELAERSSTDGARLRRILESTHDGVLVTNADGKATFVNQRLLQILGRSEDDVLGLELYELLDEPSKKSPTSDLRDSGEMSLERVILRGDGARCHAAVQMHPVHDEMGNRTGSLTIVTDLSETRTLEAQLRHSQKMEAIGRLAGGVAHDFNNLLMGILTASEMLEPNVAHDPESAELVDEITRCGHRAAALTKQLLTFGRKDVAKPEVVSIPNLIHDARAMLERVLPERIKLEVRCNDDVTTAFADPVHLEQVIINLAVNASDAMPDGGALTISVTRMSFDKSSSDRPLRLAPGAHTRIEVRDTGEGIPPENLEKIFDPFFTTKGPGHGTGLGLSTVHGTVTEASGAIIVESKIGGGTCFTIFLPEAGPVPTVDLEAGPPPSRHGRETILVVEDERGVRRVLQRALASAGYDVLTADGPERAMELILNEGKSVALVVSDVVMPNMSGPAMAEQLRLIQPQLEFLFITGYPGDSLPPELAATEGAVLHKPFTAATLTERIRQRLDVIL